MHLSDRAIELPRLVLLGAVLICAVGVTAFFALPKERTPRAKAPGVIVAVTNPGATPEANERNIVRRLEDEIAESVDDLKENGSIVSQAVHGAAVLYVSCDDGVEPRTAYDDVESAVNRVRGELPLEAQSDPGPLINDVAFENFPIIQVVVAGGPGGRQRRRIAEQLETQIRSVAGVAGVDIFGGHEPEVHIAVDPNLMMHYGFTYEDVHRAIRRANRDEPSGKLDTEEGASHKVSVGSRLGSMEAIEQVPIGVYNGKPILLADLARVRMGHEKLTSIARYGGKDAAVLLVRPKTDIDVLAAADTIQQIVDRFDPEDPSVDVSTTRSQGREIRYMLNQLGTSALYGTILVIIILCLFMGWRNAGLIGIAVPFAILTTFAFMWLSKRTIFPDLAINNMTLFALILVVGLVVDGCIIVGENIFRHRQLGTAPVEAAKRGVREVGVSLMCAYLTTFAAFGPMFIVRGIMGDFLKLMPVVVLFALGAAILVDHFLLPVLTVYLMKPSRRDRIIPEEDDRPEALTIEQRDVRSAEAFAGSSRAARLYGRMITFALHHRLLVLAMALVLTLIPVGLFTSGAVGVEFFPESDMAVIEVYFELPLGSAMESRTVAVAGVIEEAVERAVKPDEWYRPTPDSPPVQPVTTIGDPGALNIRFDTEHGSGPEYGMVYVELALAEDRVRTVRAIREAIAAEIPLLPDVIVNVRSPEEGPPVGAPVVLRVLGQAETSMDALARRADAVERLLRAIPGTYDVKSDYQLRPDIIVTPHRVQASLFGVDTAAIGTSVSFALEGVRAGKVDFGGDEEIDLRIRNQRSDRDQLEDLMDLPLLSPDGRRVILTQVAGVKRGHSPNVIRHYDRRRVINIRCQIEEGVLVDDVRAQMAEALRPEGRRAAGTDVRDYLLAIGAVRERSGDRVLLADEDVAIEFGGETEHKNDAMYDLRIAMLIALAIMLIVLVLKFNSFLQPLIILSSVPLSLVGVAIGLAVCGLQFSVSSMIGVVALAGIVVNDAIVLVDFINRLRGADIPVERAIVFAGQLRLRPIFLTTITTIAGLLPLALNLAGGGEFWQPLTVTIMFGLAFATLLQLFVIPLACYTFDRRRHVSRLDPMRRPELAGPAPVAT